MHSVTLLEDTRCRVASENTAVAAVSAIRFSASWINYSALSALVRVPNLSRIFAISPPSWLVDAITVPMYRLGREVRGDLSSLMPGVGDLFGTRKIPESWGASSLHTKV